MGERLAAADVFAAIESHYGNSAVVIAEVPNGTGSHVRRHIDALALGCWPSRGLFVHAIEIKVRKDDLRRELATPEKADAIAKYADKMFLATPAGLVEDVHSLPEAWGLLEVSGTGVKTRKPATAIEAQPLGRSFVMGVIRAACQQKSDARRVERLVSEARADERQRTHEILDADAERCREAMLDAQRELSDLRSKLGSRYALRELDVGNAVKILNSLTGRVGALNTLRVSARKILQEADDLERIAKSLGIEPDEQGRHD